MIIKEINNICKTIMLFIYMVSIISADQVDAQILQLLVTN